MTTSPRSRLAHVGFSAIALALLGTTCADQPRPLTPIRVGFIQSVDQIPIAAMDEQGFAARRGLRLAIKTVAGGRAALEALAAGSLDVAYAGSLPVLSAARAGDIPDRVTVVGASSFADETHPGMTVLAPAGTRWADLAGRTIAINQVGSIGDVAVRLRLTQEGVVPGAFVEVAFPNQGLAVSGGNVGAAVMTEPFVTQSLQRGDGAVLGPVIGGGDPFPRFVMAFIAVRTELVRERPEVAKAVLDAHLDALAWIADHEKEARGILARRLGLDDRVAARMSMAGMVRDARIDEKLVATMQARLAGADPALAPIAPEVLYDERLLAEVLERRR